MIDTSGSMSGVPVCETCKDWGTPGDYHTGHIIRCSKCNRNYWPNQGVNMPVGAAVGIAAAQSVAYLQRVRGGAYHSYLTNKLRKIPTLPKASLDDNEILLTTPLVRGRV